MLGPQLIWFEIAIAPLLAALRPTNPSSLILAAMAVIFGVSFQLVVRPGHQNRSRHLPAVSADPQETEDLIRPRRVA